MFEVDKEDSSVWVYDVIGDSFFGGISAGMMKSALNELGKDSDISIRVNSPGGVIDEATAMFNMLKNHRGKVTAYVDSIAASSASFFIMAADEIVMAQNALMMVHKPHTLAIGDADEMRKTADVLDKYQDSIEKSYLSRSNIDAERLSELMNDETWMTAEEAVEMNFADSISEVNVTMENRVDRLKAFGYKNVPDLKQDESKDQDQIDRINYTKMKVKLGEIKRKGKV